MSTEHPGRGDEFQSVLHTWACRQLDTKSGHVGPFEIKRVRLSETHGHSIDCDKVEVVIEFRHSAVGCPDAQWMRDRRCQPEQVWWMPDTTDTVTMLNELLTLGDKA